MNNVKKLLLNNYQEVNSKLITIFIDNENYNCHYEIIESIIVKYNEIINIKFNDNEIKIFIKCYNNIEFINYIKNKYNYVIFANCINPNYHIYSTIYDRDYNKIIKNL